MKTSFSLLAVLVALISLSACGGDQKDHAHKDHDHKDHGHKDHGHDHDDDAHVHEAPRGGTLVELGDHAANVELVIDADRKVFALYALDAHAENAARIAQPQVEIVVHPSKAAKDAGEAFTISLAAVANENTGEKVGDTSQFEVPIDALKGHTAFEGIIKSITVKGAKYDDVKFKFEPKK